MLPPPPGPGMWALPPAELSARLQVTGRCQCHPAGRPPASASARPGMQGTARGCRAPGMSSRAPINARSGRALGHMYGHSSPALRPLRLLHTAGALGQGRPHNHHRGIWSKVRLVRPQRLWGPNLQRGCCCPLVARLPPRGLSWGTSSGASPGGPGGEGWTIPWRGAREQSSLGRADNVPFRGAGLQA